MLALVLALAGCGETHGPAVDASAGADGSTRPTDDGGVADDESAIDGAARLALPDEGRDTFYVPGTFADLDGDGFDDIVLVNTVNWGDAPPYHGGGFAILYGRADRSPPTADELVEIRGPTHQTAGVWVARGEYDGDGLDDVVIGIPGIGTDFGSLHVLYGARTRLSGSIAIDDVAPALTWNGLVESPVSFPGPGTCAGDVDGDGRDDLLIAHPSYATAGGVAYLLLGSAARWPGAVTADATFTVPDLRSPYVAGGGDMDGDGHVDLVLGDRAPDGSESRFDLFYGPITLGTHALDDADAHVATGGYSAFAGRDANGDGLADLAVGDGTFGDGPVSGPMHVFLGSHTRLAGDVAPTAAPITISPLHEGDGLGMSFDVGDTDGDGAPDVLVALPYADDRDGRMALLLGPLRSRSATDADRSWLGTSAALNGGHGAGVTIEGGAALGDFDGDGFDDVLLGGGLAGATTSIGAVYLAYGAAR